MNFQVCGLLKDKICCTSKLIALNVDKLLDCPYGNNVTKEYNFLVITTHVFILIHRQK